MARGTNLTGVRVTVYGRPVWPKALCQLVEAVDRRAFLDECMASRDFMPLGVDPGSEEERFLEDVMDRRDVPWSRYGMREAHVDRVLAGLGS
jgi:hypothetical protein